jgi:hypothetical protein
MGLLTGLASDADIKQETDSVGGTKVFPSGTYSAVIDAAFLGKSKGGATSLTMHYAMPDGSTFRNVLWIVSGDAKGNKNYYVNKNGDKHFLPGFNAANSISVLAIDKKLTELEEEDKVITLYDFDLKKEIPKKVPMLTELIGQEITIGLIEQTVDKNVKTDAGEYVASGETRQENEVDKVFRTSDGITLAELTDGKPPEFITTWTKKWIGEVRNKAKGAPKGAGVVAGAPKASTAPKESLFG